MPPLMVQLACKEGEPFRNTRTWDIETLRNDLRADGGNGTSIQSEDCLRINIIAPANATNLPVYLYAQ